MLKKLASLIRRIIGRIKKMPEITAAFGAMLIPLGMIIRIQDGKPSFLAYFLVIVGFISFFLGLFFALLKEWKEKRKEEDMKNDKEEVDRVEYNKFMAQQEIQNKMLTSLNDLVKEIRQERNERKTHGDTKRTDNL
jgi:hypothetical protein